MFIMGLFSSCNDKDNLPELNGTVWIHEYSPKKHIKDVAAIAIYFGKNKVERYALDENMKVLRLITTVDYQVRDGAIAIGMEVGPMGDDLLYFRNHIYYRSTRSITDILIR